MDRKSEALGAAASARDDRRTTILIVEDSPVQAELLRRALDSAGYRVIAAGDGAAGLALAKTSRPAAVVSDINMPVMDGYAMCQAIRGEESIKATPVILLTMLSDPQDVIRGLNAGADAYLTKPYNIPSLLGRLASLLANPPEPPPATERRKLKVFLAGKARSVDASGPRMLNLLISTYENAVLQTRELNAAQQTLEDLNQHLEQRVREQTAALQASERRFRALIENASDLVLVIDTQGMITYVSPSVKRIGGYEPSELVGKGITEFIHRDDAATAHADLAALVQNPGGLRTAQLRYRSKEGAWIILETVAKSAIDDPSIAGVVVNARDITERKLAAERVAKLNRLYATLSGINLAIVRSTTAVELFERVCQVAVEQGRFDMAWIGTIDPAQRMIMPVVQRGLSPEILVSIRDSIGPILQGRGRTATAIREGRTIYSNDDAVELASTPWQAEAERLGIRGSAALPIKQGGEIVGVFKLYVRERNFFDSEQLALLDEMCSDISFAMDRFDIEAKKTQAEAALRDAETRYRGIFAESRDGILLIDAENGLVADCNPEFERQSGRCLAQLRELHIWELRPPDAQDKARAKFEEVKVEGVGGSNELPLQRPDGTVLPIEFVSTRMRIGERDYLQSTCRDISARKRAEEELRRLNWALRALGQSNSALVHAGTEEELFQTCCNAIAGAGGYPLAWIGRALDNAAHSIEVAAAAGEAIEYLQGLEVSWADTPLGQGPTGTAIRTGATQLANTLSENAAYLPWIEKARAHGLASSISLPIRNNNTTIGTLAVYSREQNAFGRPEVDLFEELAADIGYGIASRRTHAERNQLQQQQLRSVELLKSALIATIGAVALTVEKRDPYTAGHQQRVAELSVAIGRKLDLSEDRIEGLRLGATIHDIGKIAVPSEILSRPGKLSALEFELIKAHPQVGYEIVKNVKFPWPVTEMILQHHERLDGSGYPQHLTAGEIVLEARIIAVADVVEAMSSHRPYRPGLGIDVALAEIERGRAILYDEVVADACLNLFRQHGYTIPALIKDQS